MLHVNTLNTTTFSSDKNLFNLCQRWQWEHKEPFSSLTKTCVCVCVRYIIFRRVWLGCTTSSSTPGRRSSRFCSLFCIQMSSCASAWCSLLNSNKLYAALQRFVSRRMNILFFWVLPHNENIHGTSCQEGLEIRSLNVMQQSPHAGRSKAKIIHSSIRGVEEVVMLLLSPLLVLLPS